MSSNTNTNMITKEQLLAILELEMQELEDLRKKVQELQNENQQNQQQIALLQQEPVLFKQSNTSCEQLLKEKDRVIMDSLHVTIGALNRLVESKTNENALLQKENNRLNIINRMSRKTRD
ncbi:hypothetical protein K501DRAFT_265506 [Backusella circina FSU 941]|nr:hypothetical protein K501DRAFT_265506 [Backusella circina FSU 941]